VLGLSAGESTTFVTQLVGGEHAGSDADVAVTVRTVKERELPPVDDDFAQLASEFDTLEELRGDLKEQITRVKKVEQLYAARDKALSELVERASVPAPEGVVADEVAQRKQSMVDQLERMGASLTEYLAAEEKTEEQIDADLAEAAAEGVRIQLVLDTIAETENIEVTDDEFGHEVVHRAQRFGMQPQQYYDELVRAGAAAAVYGDVRRGKALARVMEQVIMTDTNGEVLTLDALRGAGELDEHAGHNH
jgi:trigger factor